MESFAMADLELEIKRLIVNCLALEGITPEEIDSDEPLFGEGLGLDSIDGLELGMALRKAYGVKIEFANGDVRGIFASVHSLAHFIAAQKATS